MHYRPFVDGQENREGVARLWEIKEDWAQLATKMRTYGPSSSGSPDVVVGGGQG